MKRVPRNVVTVNGSILFIFLVAEENLVRTVTGRPLFILSARLSLTSLVSSPFSFLYLDGDDDKEVEEGDGPLRAQGLHSHKYSRGALPPTVLPAGAQQLSRKHWV